MLKAYLTTLIILLIFVNGKSQDASTLYIKGKDALKTNTSKAFNILDSAQTIADKTQNTSLSIKTRKLKGYAKYYEGDFSNAILAFGQALEIAKINDSTALQFDLCNALGASYKFVGDYGKSINYFNDAYQKALVLNDTEKVAKSTNNLGVLFRLNKDYKNSIKLLKEAEEIYRTQGDSISLGETLNNLGLSYSSIDSLEKARVYYNNSLRLKSLKGKTVSYAKTLNNIGLTEQLLKDYKKAQTHFEEAILVAEQANNLYQMASFKINLLDLQVEQNNTFNQEELLNGLEKTILSYGFVDLKPRLYLLKSNFTFTQKNYQKAIDFRDIYYKIQDSLYTEESKSAIANAKLIKEIEEKKNENLILSQQNLIQGLEIKQKQLTNTLVFIGLILLVLVSILLYLRFNRLKKLYQRLNKQETLLIKEKNAAQKANNYKSEFLANMSHEIRTPLSGIKGSINLLKENVDKDEKLEILKILDQSSDTLMRIINDILDLSKIESGNITLSKESFDLKAAVEEVISSQSFVAKAKNIDLEVIIPQNLPKLSGDGTRLKQVLYNLVGNAIKFTQSGIVKLTIEKPDKNNSSSFIYLYFSISDTGVGISQNQIKNIFSPFTQANDQIAKTYGGTGLGLAISNQIISLMGGKLHVKSELDKGATFWFSIPFTISEETQQANNPNSSNINAKPLSKDIKILLVEDNKINQTIFKLSLDKIGYNFEVQENGKLGFEAYKKHQYPLIFMDIRMPEMDGITSTSYIRKFEEENHLKPSKIVAFTANAMIGDKEKYLEAGMDDFLAKPFNPNELKEIIEKYLVKKNE